MTEPDRARDATRDLFAAILGSSGGPGSVTHRMVTELFASLVARIDTMHDADGYAPQNLGELSLLLTVLFGETLTDLKATSIHSNNPLLQSYKGYWDDPILGPLFKKRNQEFLDGGGSVERIYVCDSVAHAVTQLWFTTAVVPQARANATVRVTQLETRSLPDYQDFGIYEHLGHGGKYLLLAPPDKNANATHLQTEIIFEYDTIKRYETKFASLQSQAKRYKPVTLLPRGPLDEIPAASPHGTGTINGMMGGKVVLRRLRRLDTKVPLIDDKRIVRKLDPQYANAVFKHIQEKFSDVRTIVYVGDTQGNDGILVRNLQAKASEATARAVARAEKSGASTEKESEAWKVYGFICEPGLEIDGLWLNDVLYTDRWTDLTHFAEVAKEELAAGTLGLFDIDQTLWAAKGVSDGPLIDLRRAAASALVERYFASPLPERLLAETRERVVRLYDELGAIKYHRVLTLDNEDLRVGIAMTAALNLMRAPDDSEGDPITDAWLAQIAKKSPAQFAKYVIEKCLPRIGRTSDDGWSRAADTIKRAKDMSESSAYRAWAEAHGIDLPTVQQDVRKMFDAMHSATAAVQYPEFRRAELEQTIARTDPALPVDERLVINKPAWDFACWLRDADATLLALSDRPEEATHPRDDESVLDKGLTIFGSSIVELLPDPKPKKRTPRLPPGQDATA